MKGIVGSIIRNRIQKMATPSAVIPPPAPKSNDAYFQDKRGEINDLKNLLRDIHVERDPRKKREVVRKVIAFDTLGYDCSKLFSEMVLATSTNDIVVKKMAYQYLSHYARSNEELATLCVNTMTKDCRDADPMVRGLAIRSLSSLRLKSTVEYLVPLLVSALDDPAPYVRRNAAVAVLKLFYLQPDLLLGEDAPVPFLSKLQQLMMSDRDPTVVSASIQTLEEVFRERGGVQCDGNMFRLFLARSQEFNEWGLCTVLTVLGRYNPQASEEMFEAMNVLDPCLRQTNSAVVLSCAKIFSKYAELVPDIKTQVYLRLKEPLLTLISASTMEIKYTTLCHLELFIRESSIVFEDSFKSFFLKFDEPFQVKKIKLRILPLLASLDNYQEMLSELQEYASDVNFNLAKQAIVAVARVGVQVGSSGVDQVLLKLLEFLESLDEHLKGDVLDAFKDVLQYFPDRAPLVVPALPRFVLREIRGSAIWMMGEFGAQLEQAPYLLERLVDRVDELDSFLRCELLSSLMKLFFKERALESRPALEKLLKVMLNDVSDVDAHDRAMFYYRLLKQDLFKTGEILNDSSVEADAKRRPLSTRILEADAFKPTEFFEELNTLAVVYGKHASQFVDESHLFPEVRPASPLKTNVPDVVPPSTNNNGNFINNGDDMMLMMESGQSPLIGLSPPQQYPGTSNSQAIGSYLPQFEIDQTLFQTLWMVECPDVKAVLEDEKPVAISVSDLEDRLVRANIKCMASGNPEPHSFKFYFYAMPATGNAPVLAEVLVYDGRQAMIMCKTPGSAELAEAFANDIFDLM